MTLTALSPAQMFKTVAAMERHGGSFCRALARAWYSADGANKLLIEGAFAHILANYAPGTRFHEDI